MLGSHPFCDEPQKSLGLPVCSTCAADIVSGLKQSSGDDQNRNPSSQSEIPPPRPPKSKGNGHQKSNNYGSESNGGIDPGKIRSIHRSILGRHDTPPLPPKLKENDHQESIENDAGSGEWTQEMFDQFTDSLRAQDVTNVPASLHHIPPPRPPKSKGNGHQKSNNYGSESNGGGSTQERLDPYRDSFGVNMIPPPLYPRRKISLKVPVSLHHIPPPYSVKPKGNGHQKPIGYGSRSNGKESTQERLDSYGDLIWVDMIPPPHSVKPKGNGHQKPIGYGSGYNGGGSTQERLDPSTDPFGPKGNGHQKPIGYGSRSNGEESTQERLDSYGDLIWVDMIPPPHSVKPKGDDRQTPIEYGSGSTHERLDPSTDPFWVDRPPPRPPKSKGNDQQKPTENTFGSGILGDNYALEGMQRQG
ncbi:hypothetical protein BASA83_003356 [Batrachochytrium salamandrivorans]|nr:hypothetical protein BASA83_003356 [Batrachochytrium salamandrivorans]